VSPDYAKSAYRRGLTNQVTIRRFSGPAGPNRAKVDVDCRAWIKRARAAGGAATLVSDVMQYEYTAVVLVEDLVAGGLALPITTADKLVFDGREMAISFPDNATRSVGTELIAYNLTVKG